MKTKRTRLAPIAVASLLAGVRQARYNVKRDETRVVRKEVLLLEKNQRSANAPSILKVLYYFYFLFVSSLSTSTPKNRLVFYRYFCTQ